MSFGLREAGPPVPVVRVTTIIHGKKRVLRWKKWIAVYSTSFIKSTTCWNAISSRLANWARTFRFKHIFELLKEKRKSLYLIPCDRTAALILVIQRLLKSRRRWSRSRCEAESAFKACWFAVRKSVEEEPRNPFAIFKILFRRLRATFPRFTRVILLLDIYVCLFLIQSKARFCGARRIIDDRVFCSLKKGSRGLGKARPIVDPSMMGLSFPFRCRLSPKVKGFSPWVKKPKVQASHLGWRSQYYPGWKRRGVYGWIIPEKSSRNLSVMLLFFFIALSSLVVKGSRQKNVFLVRHFFHWAWRQDGQKICFF